MKKLGLALGAGGARGVAHIGFLQALEEEDIRPDFIVGSSMGAVIGAAYAMGTPISTMKRAAESLRLLNLITPTKQKGGLFGTQKIRMLLERYIGDKQIEEAKIPFHAIAVDMRQQEVVEFSKGSILDAVIASASIPTIFHPLTQGDQRFIDGGVLERVPAMRLKKMGAEVIVAVDVLGWRTPSTKIPGMVGVLLETFDIMDNYRTKEYYLRHKRDIDFWLEPDLGDVSQYDLKILRYAYEKGYELGKEYAPKIARELKRAKISEKINKSSKK